MFPSDAPKNRKPKVFWCFQGGKGDIGKESIMNKNGCICTG